MNGWLCFLWLLVAKGMVATACSDTKCFGTNKIAYANLQSPTLNATTVLLATELKAQYPDCAKRDMSIRQCIHMYAKEAEEDAKRSKISKRLMGFRNQNKTQNSREHVKAKTPVLGSDERIVRTNGNFGFFSTILEAYNNHWTLRTCVEDWWYTIIRKIAVAIDDNSKSQEVREFFVSHEGKKRLKVRIGPSIYGADYSRFLDQMTEKIASNVKVPNYVDMLKADFSTSTKTHVIISEITVMASVQEYFEYVGTSMCGIPSLEMEGELEDWKQMKNKFLELKNLLQPIHKQIGLHEKWWNGVERICEQLISSFKGKPDVKWWSHIFTFKAGWGSGAINTYDGWFISELLGLGSINSLSKVKNGIITVPMKVENEITGISEDSAFAAGIAGFEIFKQKNSQWPSVKAAHGWTLMLEPNSTFRADLTTWESQLPDVV